jgi:histidinol phosphatase-like enzyme (inositol monophosphatase family)
MSVEAYMQAAGELAKLASDNAMRYYRAAIDVIEKTDGSPVTIADRSSEKLLREWIERKFPSDGIVGEEFGTTNSGARRRWVVDPIDGTKAFIRGVPFWGSLVAIVEDETVIAGAASFGALGETLAAGAGEGCWWNDAPCRVSTVSDLSRATVLTSDIAFRSNPERKDGWMRLAGESGVSRTWGDCVGYLLVATGRAEAMVDPVIKLWDIAPFIPAITEAGGVFTDWDGSSGANLKSAVATNSMLADTTRAILRGDGQ